MPPAVIYLKNEEDPRDAIHRAVAALADGKIIAFPTETVYGLAASALDPVAVRRLQDIKGRDECRPFAIAVKSADDGLDYVPEMPMLARRLARRCWPGPLTLVLKDAHPDSVISRLPADVQKTIVHDGNVGLRVPAHEVALQTLRLAAGPLVLTSANLSNQPEAVESQEIVDQLGEAVDLILDDGRCKFGQSSTVVHVEENRLRILREGVIDRSTLKRMSEFFALVVCTGNTCRSPMAEMLLQKKLAERVGCPIHELVDHGIHVVSAGIAAMPGSPPSKSAVDVMAEFDLDLSKHASQPATDRLAHFADLILTMTNGHRQAIVNHWPEITPRVHLMRRDGADVCDPIGQSVDVYRECANQIDENLAAWVGGLELPDIEVS